MAIRFVCTYTKVINLLPSQEFQHYFLYTCFRYVKLPIIVLQSLSVHAYEVLNLELFIKNYQIKRIHIRNTYYIKKILIVS